MISTSLEGVARPSSLQTAFGEWFQEQTVSSVELFEHWRVKDEERLAENSSAISRRKSTFQRNFS